MILADEPTGNLDSHATADVLDLLDELRAPGRTIVLITHEPDVAERAQRIVRVRDGLIQPTTLDEAVPRELGGDRPHRSAGRPRAPAALRR